jgi:sulfur-oxidizing protein SoxZ
MTDPVRALINVQPNPPRRGEPCEVRTLITHPMETGYRSDSLGRRLPRDVVRRFEARLDGELVFAADLHAAIAANPYIAFPLVVHDKVQLEIHWRGDNGFAHSLRVALEPV